MLALSVKLTKKRAAVLLLAVFAAVCAAFIAFSAPKDGETSVSYDAADAAGCAAFLRQFGWETETAPLEEEDVVIPDPLDEVYAQYNEIQKAQGLDIGLYAGKTVRHIKLRVTNYPSGADNAEANLLIYDGRVIAGDICTPELNGAMHGFDLSGTGLDLTE